MPPIYLDYNATTPIDPAVLEAMMPYLREHFGNPSSTHAYGRKTHEAVDKARGQVAELLGADADEIIFTSGGSEASNQALKGSVFATLYGTVGGGARRLASSRARSSTRRRFSPANSSAASAAGSPSRPSIATAGSISTPFAGP